MSEDNGQEYRGLCSDALRGVSHDPHEHTARQVVWGPRQPSGSRWGISRDMPTHCPGASVKHNGSALEYVDDNELRYTLREARLLVAREQEVAMCGRGQHRPVAYSGRQCACGLWSWERTIPSEPRAGAPVDNGAVLDVSDPIG